MSDEIRFLLLPVDGRGRIWCHGSTALHDVNVMDITAFHGGAITVRGAVFLIVS